MLKELVDDQTFKIWYNEGPGINSYNFIMVFKDDAVSCELVGLGKAEARIIE
jgi:hypothetical protein